MAFDQLDSHTEIQLEVTKPQRVRDAEDTALLLEVGDLVTLPKIDAVKLIDKGVAKALAYSTYSEALGGFLWVTLKEVR